MGNDLTLKVYEVDYSFIIKNYLSPDLWDKTWTLFVYKNIRISLNLFSIEVMKPRNIVFKISINAPSYSSSTFVYYDKDNSNFNVLKRQISGAIENCISYFENDNIRSSDYYKRLEDNYVEERNRLEKLANDYLDNHNITLEDVREAYIDKYVDDNAKGYVYMNNYINGRKYMENTDLWLVYYKSTKNEEKYKKVYDIVSKNIGFEELLQELSEYTTIMESDKDSDTYNTYIDDMYNCLEGI